MSAVDSVKITVSPKYRPNDFSSVLYDVASEIPAKESIYVFAIFILLSTDVYISRIMGRIDGATSYTDSLTCFGVILTGMLFVLLFIIVDLLIKKGVL